MIGAMARGVSRSGLLLALGCGWLGAGTQPDDMSAEAHRREAKEHFREKAEHRERYDPEARDVPVGRWYGAPPYGYRDNDFYWGTGEYNPTAIHLRQAAEHERHAREHLEAARALEEFEEGQCQASPPETRVVCPLVGQVKAIEDVARGVRVQIAEGVNVNAAVAHMRCHQAFARTRGRVGMDTCPLYLRGVYVERTGQSRAVDLTVSDADDLDELRRRARLHLEPQMIE